MAQPLTPAAAAALKAPVEETQFTAEFGFVPPGAREGLILTSSLFGQLGNRLDQLNNRLYSMGAPWMSGERNRNLLNGQMRFLDDSQVQQTGDWSTVQSDGNGDFMTPPYIHMTLDQAYDLVGAQIIFDNLSEEWATAIKVGYYNNAGTLIQEQIFTNDRASMSINWAYNAVRHIRFTILSWSLPRRFAKICQVIPGQIRYFDRNSFSFVLRESVAPFKEAALPEYSITFANENQAYNIINPEGVVALLRGKMEIPAKIGVVTPAGIDYISVGDFPLHTWPDNAQYAETTFFCRPDIVFGGQPYTSASSGGATYTIAQLAAAISTQAGLRFPVVVDLALQAVQAWSNNQIKSSLDKALSELAVAAGGYLKYERDGSYTIKPVVFGATTRTLYSRDIWGEPNITQMPEIVGIKLRSINLASNVTELLVPPTAAGGAIEDVVSDFMRVIPGFNHVTDNAFAYFSHRLKYEISYRGDPSIEAGDVIEVETMYGLRRVFVTHHEITYNSVDFLQGRLEGIGVDL